MPSFSSLLGLDRLISVCQRHSLPVKLNTPSASTLPLEEPIFGEPFDPQLAAMYQRLGGGELGLLSFYTLGPDWLDLLPWNEHLRRHDTVHFRSSLIFSEETGFPLYYGTVPKLADAQGLQPVVHVDGNEVQYAVPVASSVDRFFDAYSRYLELIAVDQQYIHHGVPTIHFPWSVPHIIARDEPLMEQVGANRFDFLTNDVRDALQWLQKLRAARP